MPIYEFKCQKCGHEFEQLVLNRREKPPCPACGGQRCEKWLSSFRCGPSGGAMDIAGASSTSSSCGSCAASSCAGCGSTH